MLLLDILEEHVDEMSFLFSQRLHALEALTLDFTFLTGLDERLEAHLDGLLVGTDSSWELCRPLLGGEHPEEAFVAWSVALRSPLPWNWTEELPADLPAGPALEGVRWALRLSTSERTAAVLARLLGSENAATRAIALDAMTFRRGDPGPALRAALRSSSPPLLHAGNRRRGAPAPHCGTRPGARTRGIGRSHGRGRGAHDTDRARPREGARPLARDRFRPRRGRQRRHGRSAFWDVPPTSRRSSARPDRARRMSPARRSWRWGAWVQPPPSRCCSRC